MTFTSDGSEILSKPTTQKAEIVNFYEYFEIESTAAFLVDYSNIALQFPDQLLPYSTRVIKELQKHLNASQSIFILADTSYGSCCVDQVAAEHSQSDVIIHYGPACAAPIDARIPIHYVFGREECNVDDAVAAFPDPCTIHLFFDAVYEWAINDIQDGLKARGFYVTRDFMNTNVPREVAGDSAVLYFIGKEGYRLTNLLMTNSNTKVYTWFTTDL